MIEIKEPDKEECKLKRIHRQIRNNAKLNQIEVARSRNSQMECTDILGKPIESVEGWTYDFSVLEKSRPKRWLKFFFPYTVRFWAKLNTKTCVLTIENVGEHLFDRIYEAAKVLFSDIEGLTVVIEKDYC